MTDEQEALAMVNEVRDRIGFVSHTSIRNPTLADLVALRAVQERKAFAQEVSDAVEAYNTLWHKHTPSRDTFMEMLGRFIITKPDPLVEVIRSEWPATFKEGADIHASRLRAAIAKHNGRIVFDD